MKKTLFIIFYLIINSICFSQSFPKVGAIWIFKASNMGGMDVLAQKWEFEGDSTSTEGVFKKFRITTKIVNPAWNPNESTEISVTFQNFLYKGDTIWNMSDSLSPIANFSLQVGDSMYTPYHSVSSSLYPLIMDSLNNCSLDVQHLFFQKGIVDNVGSEINDGINSRYYQLKFLDEFGDTLIRKFYERSIITEAYWHYNVGVLNSCSSTDSPDFKLLCYKDDYTTDAVCNADEWFEKLSVKNNLAQIKRVEIYPNPANGFITIKANELDLISIKIYSINGEIKSKLTKWKPNMNNEMKFDISTFQSGVYFVELLCSDTKLVSYFVKN